MDDLRRVLVWVKERFPLLWPDEFLYSSDSGVLLTFDDGLANNYANVLPMLREFDAPAVLFVTTQHVACPKDWLAATRNSACRYWGSEERVPSELAKDFYDGMSKDQLALCAGNSLIAIGSHTVSHPFLTQCDGTQLDFEVVESKRFLEEVTGQRVNLFAYPAGHYNRSVAEAVRIAGYRAAFAEDTRNVGLPLFEIPRIGIYASDPAYMSLKLSGLHRFALRGRLRAE
jgi:peptidoglycan/xylan/chitin deacetylase (PgdA/CDA1 family)